MMMDHMTNYIINNYKTHDCKEMAKALDLDKHKVYKLCYDLSKQGKLKMEDIYYTYKTTINHELEASIIKLRDTHTIKDIASVTGVKLSDVITLSNRLLDCGIVSRKTNCRSLKYMKGKADKDDENIRLGLIRDKEYDEMVINKNKAIHKEREKHIGDIIKDRFETSGYKKTFDVKVIKIYPRFYLCQSKSGFKTCIPKM